MSQNPYASPTTSVPATPLQDENLHQWKGRTFRITIRGSVFSIFDVELEGEKLKRRTMSLAITNKTLFPFMHDNKEMLAELYQHWDIIPWRERYSFHVSGELITSNDAVRIRHWQFPVIISAIVAAVAVGWTACRFLQRFGLL